MTEAQLNFIERENAMRLFYVIALPIIWLFAAVLSYFHPGDEYGLFAYSTIAGSWICFCMKNIGSLSGVLWMILLTGGVIMGVFGFAMDKSRISKKVWGVLLGICVVAVLVYSLLPYSSLDRAFRKNGSLIAYIAAACNMGLYLSVILAFIAKAIAEASRKYKLHKTV